MLSICMFSQTQTFYNDKIVNFYKVTDGKRIIKIGRLTTLSYAAYCSNKNWDIDANLCYHGYSRNLPAHMAADVQPLRDQLSDSDCVLCAYRSP